MSFHPKRYTQGSIFCAAFVLRSPAGFVRALRQLSIRELKPNTVLQEFLPADIQIFSAQNLMCSTLL